MHRNRRAGVRKCQDKTGEVKLTTHLAQGDVRNAGDNKHREELHVFCSRLTNVSDRGQMACRQSSQ